MGKILKKCSASLMAVALLPPLGAPKGGAPLAVDPVFSPATAILPEPLNLAEAAPAAPKPPEVTEQMHEVAARLAGDKALEAVVKEGKAENTGAASDALGRVFQNSGPGTRAASQGVLGWAAGLVMAAALAGLAPAQEREAPKAPPGQGAQAAVRKDVSLQIQQELLEKALAARKNAHAPFSGYYVGAAVATPAGVFTGANIENPNRKFNAHAERVAEWKSITAGAREISAMSVIHERKKTPYPDEVAQKWKERLEKGAVLSHRDFGDGFSSAPCGECRQALLGLEPKEGSMLVLYGSPNGALFRDPLSDLLPSSYRRKETKTDGPKTASRDIVLTSRFSKEDPRSSAALQKELLASAETVLPNSYIPYPSPDLKEKKQAAAVLAKSGKIYLGVSVYYTPVANAIEVALFSAYSEGERGITAIVFIEEDDASPKELIPQLPPDTLQVMSDLAGNAVLLRRTSRGAIRTDQVSALAARLRD